jgi:tetratricopeptide (TPR) repeat protein
LCQARRIREAAERGLQEDARAGLARVGSRGFEDLPRDGMLLATWIELALAAIALDDAPHAELLLARMRPHSSEHAFDEFFFSWGALAQYVGLLQRMLGDRTAAIESFEEAIELNARLRHRPERLRSQLELGLTLQVGLQAAARARGMQCLRSVREEAQKLGLIRIARAAKTALREAPPT